MLSTKSRSALGKLALCAAGGAMAVATAAGPALAATSDHTAPSTDQQRAPYWGKVIAKTGLQVRTAPNRGGKVIKTLKYGQKVAIACKVNGQWIDGNPRWYRLADGSWGWASARYIENIGKAPHWCHHHKAFQPK
ncbi:SH3 domain-containing protein [Streptomyces sp. NPDC005438]|uniref:SH3 domain-containing protein n=1 Tax=Streptomyces sp. NPDC005438 TaxID=3156880 RepID=UPI00339F9886